jgi:hypothetical protein
VRATGLIYEAVGRPDPRRDTHSATGRCYWCAAPIDARACKVDDVITDSFTDQDQALVRTSPWLCVACTWAMTGRPPDTLRLWSIAYRDAAAPWPSNHPSCTLPSGAVHAQNKADPSAFRALLREPPVGRWVCSIADSGQIHTLPFAPVNVGSGRFGVRFERTTITTTAAEYGELDAAIHRLMRAGFTKTDITDEPPPHRLVECGAELWMTERRRLAPWLRSSLLELVLFLARKEPRDPATAYPTIDPAQRPTKGSSARRRPRTSDDAERAPGIDQPAQVVGPIEERARRGSEAGEQLRLDGLDDGAQARHRRPDRKNRE